MLDNEVGRQTKPKNKPHYTMKATDLINALIAIDMPTEKNEKFTAAMAFNGDKLRIQAIRAKLNLGEKETMNLMVNLAELHIDQLVKVAEHINATAAAAKAAAKKLHDDEVAAEKAKISAAKALEKANLAAEKAKEKVEAVGAPATAEPTTDSAPAAVEPSTEEAPAATKRSKKTPEA